jgi:hypothetical protein
MLWPDTENPSVGVEELAPLLEVSTVFVEAALTVWVAVAVFVE